MRQVFSFLIFLWSFVCFGQDPCDSTFVELVACPGGTAFYQGNEFAVNSMTGFLYPNVDGCDSMVMITVVEASADIFVMPTPVSCFGESDGRLEVTEVVGGFPPFLYSLDSLSFQEEVVFDSLTFGNYTVVVQDAEGCVYEQMTTVFQPLYWEIELGADTSLLFGDNMELSVDYNTLSDVEYFWLPSEGLSCNDCPNPVAAPTVTTTYSVAMVDTYGCTKSDVMTITVLPNDKSLVFPNAFSPNRDGLNDEFRGLYEGSVTSFNVKVFNRWGEQVFLSRNIDGAWDGTHRGVDLLVGTYVYFGDIAFLDGTAWDFVGTVALIR